MKHFYEDIRGMMDYEDLYSDMVNKFPSGSHFVELGVWFGRSAAYMAVEIVNSGKQIQLDIVDNFLKSPIERATNSLNEFDFVNIIQGNTAEVAAQYRNKSLDFVFVDADHSAHGVSMDIMAWLPKMKRGGVLAGHDYENWRYPELKVAVDHILPVKKVSEMCWYYEVE
jgi:predicted O-methyltransferase YrrM